MQQIDLSTKTLDELKSLGFDLLLQGQQIAQNLQIINAEILKRQQTEIKTPKK